jgi:hypothetical protein
MCSPGFHRDEKMRALFQRIVLLPALLLAAACGGSSGGVATCTASTDCNSGQTCVSGVCTLGGSDAGTATPGAIGAACTSRTDCNTGLSCLTAGADGFPNGYCSASCAVNACASGSKCADLSGTEVAGKACENTCTGNSSCRSGYVCCAGFGNVCTPSTYCPAGSGGGSGGGSAGGTAGGSGGGSGGGTAGGSGGGHAGGSGGGSAGGSGGGSAGGSGGGSAGGTGGGSGGGIAAMCSAPVVTVGTGTFPSSQPSGCQTPIVAAPASTVYASGAVVNHIGVKRVGDPITFAVPAATGSISIVSQSTRAISANPTFTYTQTYANVCGTAAGKTQCTGAGGTCNGTGCVVNRAYPNGVYPDLITSPSGTEWYHYNYYPNLADGGSNMDSTTYHAQFGLLQTPVASAFTIPNTSQGIADSTYPAGNWTFDVTDDAYACAIGEYTDSANGVSCAGGSDAGTYDVSVVTKPAASSVGTVDVAIYLASTAFTAASAPSNSHVKRFVSSLAAFYANLGICVATVTFYDLPPWAKTAYGSTVDATKTNTCDTIDQMFTLAQPGNTLNFFFVDSITQGGSTANGQVVGIDGAIPGPSGFGGTVHTGAVVNSTDLSSGSCTGAINPTGCGADEIAYIAAHEGGHWMGLYHVSEAYGQSNDPITDTPTCGCTTACGESPTAYKCCINPATGNFAGTCSTGQPTTVSGSVCTKNTTTCGGGDYLMFWLIDTPSKGTASQQQGQIARANPLIH